MMDEPKKSDLAKGAMKPTNNAGLQTAAEPVERRAGTKGNVDQQSTYRTQIRDRVTQAGTRTSSSKGEKEGEVHSAAPPCRCRSAAAVVLRAQAQGGSGSGWGKYILKSDGRQRPLGIATVSANYPGSQ